MNRTKLQVVPTDDDLIMISQIPSQDSALQPFYIARFYDNDGCGKTRAEEVIHTWNAYPDLLAACETQDEYEQHVKHCSQCDWSENYCETGWILWNTAQNLRLEAITKAKGE